MKFLLTVAAVIAVATAVPTKRSLVSPILAGPVAVVDENNEHIAVGPAILDFEPIAVGPAIVDSFEPIAVGPALVDTFEPIAVGPALVDFPVAPSPVVIGDLAPGQPIPLVQIIVNVNSAESAPVAPAPVLVPTEEIPAHPVIVVEQPEIVPHPVIVVEQPEVVPEPVIIGQPSVVPEPVQIVDVAPVEPVQVVEVVPVEPVQVGTPIIPSPAVILPEILN